MRNSSVAARIEDEDTGVECTHCGVPMTSHHGSGGRVRYFRCGSCHRWVSSVYQDVFRGDTKVKAVQKTPATHSVNFGVVKLRLERWLASLEEQDPYRHLGVSPSTPPEAIRARYHQLAMERHPDHGGRPEDMQALNAAYERITARQG